MPRTINAVEAYAACGLKYPPNPMQEEMYEAIISPDCAVLLKAPTGTGKMEAVVVPALTHQRRLFLIYPALSLVEDQEERIAKILEHLSRINPTQPRILIVDTGADMYRRCWVNGAEQPRRRRHLFHGDVILTTLDKFLYRFFGFGEPMKSFIYPLRLRYGRQPLFCFDEAHSYDTIAYTNFVDLVKAIGFNVDAPRDLVIMTATMPASYEQDLTKMLTPVDYLSGSKEQALKSHYQDKAHYPEKHFTYLAQESTNEEQFCHAVAELVRDKHCTRQRTIVIMERVSSAISLYRMLKRSDDSSVLLYHGRQPHNLRHDVYQKLKNREEQGYLLITTSAIEVGCDLDAQVLITQLCNPEQLVQRAGRCNRRGKTDKSRIIVVGKEIPKYTCTIPEDHVLAYRTTLEEMHKRDYFDSAQLLNFHHKHDIADYRVQTMFSMLYEYVYQAERVNKPLHEKGLVITRSWEPTVTLTTGWDEDGQLHNEIKMSLIRCTTYNETQRDMKCEVWIRRYDEEHKKYVFEPPRSRYGGCAYLQDIIVRVPEDYANPDLGYEHVPKVFINGGNRQSYRHWLYALIAPSEQKLGQINSNTRSNEKAGKTVGEKIWWWYLDALPAIEQSDEEEDLKADTAEEDEDGKSV